MNIIKHKSIFLAISLILFVGSIVTITVFGLKPGIDFKGGTLWHVKIQTDENSLKNFFSGDLGIKEIIIFPSSDNNYLIRIPGISESEHQNYLQTLKNKFENVEEMQFQSIGPTIGKELRNRAVWAVVWVLLGISLYVAYAFRKVSFPIKSWKYGIITLITLFHDVVIPAGVFAVLGWKYGIEIDANFVVALLVIMGFSVHDTIVVFDRIRENLMTHRNVDFSETVNKSVNQTMARSINTSLTVVLVLLAMAVFGPPTLKYFILTILAGIIIGTYSSIFLASPLLTIWQKFSKN
ncbi:MAG: protein translocase subunit SecF [Patescibacteria group bacterium]|nr:protein translocase subunit SecF [Patescibacteria group bacterium]